MDPLDVVKLAEVEEIVVEEEEIEVAQVATRAVELGTMIEEVI